MAMALSPSAVIAGRVQGGTLGRTKPQIEEAKAQSIKPNGGPGFAYIAGPDGGHGRSGGNFPAGAFRPCPHVSGRPGLRRAVVPEASQRCAVGPGRGLPGRLADRREL